EAHGSVRGPLLALIVAFLVLGADRSIATADTGPSDPQQQLAVIDQIRAQLGSNLADAMAAQQQLRQSLQDNAAQQQSLQGKSALARDLDALQKEREKEQAARDEQLKQRDELTSELSQLRAL